MDGEVGEVGGDGDAQPLLLAHPAEDERGERIGGDDRVRAGPPQLALEGAAGHEAHDPHDRAPHERADAAVERLVREVVGPGEALELEEVGPADEAAEAQRDHLEVVDDADLDALGLEPALQLVGGAVVSRTHRRGDDEYPPTHEIEVTRRPCRWPSSCTAHGLGVQALVARLHRCPAYQTPVSTPRNIPATSNPPASRVCTNAIAANHSGQIGKPVGGRRGLRLAERLPHAHEADQPDQAEEREDRERPDRDQDADERVEGRHHHPRAPPAPAARPGSPGAFGCRRARPTGSCRCACP